jgi:hypothetical protein
MSSVAKHLETVASRQTPHPKFVTAFIKLVVAIMAIVENVPRGLKMSKDSRNFQELEVFRNDATAICNNLKALPPTATWKQCKTDFIKFYLVYDRMMRAINIMFYSKKGKRSTRYSLFVLRQQIQKLRSEWTKAEKAICKANLQMVYDTLFPPIASVSSPSLQMSPPPATANSSPLEWMGEDYPYRTEESTHSSPLAQPLPLPVPVVIPPPIVLPPPVPIVLPPPVPVVLPPQPVEISPHYMHRLSAVMKRLCEHVSNFDASVFSPEDIDNILPKIRADVEECMSLLREIRDDYASIPPHMVDFVRLRYRRAIIMCSLVSGCMDDVAMTLMKWSNSVESTLDEIEESYKHLNDSIAEGIAEANRMMQQ